MILKASRNRSHLLFIFARVYCTRVTADEAEMYGNELVTGAALSEWLTHHAPAGTTRKDIFVTSKAFQCIDAPGGIAAGCRRSLENLRLT